MVVSISDIDSYLRYKCKLVEQHIGNVTEQSCVAFQCVFILLYILEVKYRCTVMVCCMICIFSERPVSWLSTIDGDVRSTIWPAVRSGWGAADGGSGGQCPTTPEQDSPFQQPAPIPCWAEGSWKCAKYGECQEKKNISQALFCLVSLGGNIFYVNLYTQYHCIIAKGGSTVQLSPLQTLK